MITDEMLRVSAARSSELFIQAVALDYDLTQQYEPSNSFEKKIKRLVHRAKHPYFYRSVQRIASVLLAAILAGSMYLAVDTEARAVFLGWVKEVYEHSTVYHTLPNHAAETLPQYELTWLPDGFGKPNVYESEITYSALYENPGTGDVLIFGYCLLTEERQTELFTTRQPEHLVVNGADADFYVADNNSDFSNLLWIDAETGVLCTIDSTLSKEDILHIAESVCLVNPTK